MPSADAVWAVPLEGDAPETICAPTSRASVIDCHERPAGGLRAVTPNLAALARAHLTPGRWWVRASGGCEARELRRVGGRSRAMELVTERALSDGRVVRSVYSINDPGQGERGPSASTREFTWDGGERLVLLLSAGEASGGASSPSVRFVPTSLAFDVTGPTIDYLDARSGTVLQHLTVRCLDRLALVHAESGHLAVLHVGRDVVAWREEAAEHWYAERSRCEGSATTVVARLGCGSEASAKP